MNSADWSTEDRDELKEHIFADSHFSSIQNVEEIPALTIDRCIDKQYSCSMDRV